MSETTIRPATPADIPFMWDMLFESAFTTSERRAAWRSDPQRPPDLVKYLDGWGRLGDSAVIAVADDGAAAGAAWYRLFAAADRGDGVLAPEHVPEIAIAVAPQYRRRGVGDALLIALAQRARDDGSASLLLSVDPRNAPALRLYARRGWRVVDTDDPAAGTSLIMQLDV